MEEEKKVGRGGEGIDRLKINKQTKIIIAGDLKKKENKKETDDLDVDFIFFFFFFLYRKRFGKRASDSHASDLHIRSI